MRFAIVMLFLLLGFALWGCSPFPERPAPPALHDFGAPAGITGQDGAMWSTVAVEAPDWLQDERIRYRLAYADPTQVRFYARDRWLAPPPSLLAQRLAVSGGGNGYRLRIGLLDFEQVFEGPQRARAILRFRATAKMPTDDRVAGQRLFQFARGTPSADAAGAVMAFAALVDEAIAGLNAWMAELPPIPKGEARIGDGSRP